MEHSDSIGQLAAAKAKAQAEFTAVKKDLTANAGRYSYNYADLAACLSAVVPALSKYDLALFQPVRVSDGAVVATTLLVHGESGQWISEEFAVPAVDVTDAQVLGSAATYAKRYGAQGLLGFAPEDEDDDGQAARGGDHPMAKTKQSCPSCGQTSAVIKGKPEYGGGFVCYKAKGGCGAKWQGTEDAPLVGSEIPMPKELPVEGKPVGEPAGASNPRPVPQPRAGSTKLRSVNKGSAPSQAGQASTEAPVEPAPQAQRPGGVGDASRPVVTFEVDGEAYTTNGMTEKQFTQSMALVRQMDEKVARGAGRILLAEVLDVPVKKASRTDCTEAEAQTWIEKMQKALEGRG